ncbi:hypothetical protein KY290_036742 [Solanum tuberosum]|uniref:PDZ domain-containing protein n=1 Tax=Solanum tuberosum TaxID=4113 RepID=A0ABQ7TTK5_SOLTU|nr:hypothetical protein KY289_036231 [Solanum tuberosum]KAH0639471.1 hypothetical protein KY285_036057 [Solanum tuberosum]KAH0738037.1 hypothetical protein KY290_036742 [Solanum tuberosum]
MIFERSKKANEHPRILIKPLKLEDCTSDHRAAHQSQLPSFSSIAFPMGPGLMLRVVRQSRDKNDLVQGMPKAGLVIGLKS